MPTRPPGKITQITRIMSDKHYQDQVAKGLIKPPEPPKNIWESLGFKAPAPGKE